MNIITRVFLALAIVTGAWLVNGCVSTSHGSKLDRDKVAQIKKGVTTRSEVEGLLGPPTSAHLLGDGRRTLMYTFTEMQSRATAASYVAAIPVPFMGSPAAWFIGGKKGQLKNQMLQVILSKDEVVEDYEFTDTVSHIESSGGIATSRETVAPVSATKNP